MFAGLAGMEDAQVKAGNGLVKREVTEMQSQQPMSTADYFKARRTARPDSDEMRKRKEKQAGLRKLLDGKVRALVQEDMRYR